MRKDFVLPAAFETLRSQVEPPYQRLATLTARQLGRLMPDMQIDDKGTGFVVFEPLTENLSGHVTDYDKTEAIVMPYELGNAHGPYNMFRVLWLQMLLDKPTRIIGFPNSTRRTPIGMEGRHVSTTMSFTPNEHEILASGNLEPIADRHFRVLDLLGVERVNYIAASQGASVAGTELRKADQAELFEVGNSLLIDPPSMELRNRKKSELTIALYRTLLAGDFFRAVSHTGIQELQRLHQVRPRDVFVQYYDSIFKGLKDLVHIPELNPIISGLGKKVLLNELKLLFEHNQDVHITLVRGGRSAVTSYPAVRNMKDELSFAEDRFEAGSVEPYGHGVHHNIPLITLISLIALLGARLPEAVRLPGLKPDRALLGVS